MKGDFSRNTFDKKKHFTSVRMQQGRVQLDADWNEQMDIIDNRIRVGSEDFIGGSGAPSGNPGYKITPTTTDLTIGKGRFYVQGVLIEKDKQEKFTEQADFPEAILPTTNGLYLAYLDVWQQGVSAIDDTSIEEPALNGADTTTRIKNVAQVKLLALPNSQFTGTTLKCKDVIDNDTKNKPAWTTATAKSTGKLSATVSPNANLKNQLYRIEIHKGGDQNTATLKWSRDNGALVAAIKNIDKNIITIDSIQNKILNFKVNQWVELSARKKELQNKPGIFVQLIKVNRERLTLSRELTSTEQAEFKVDNKFSGVVRKWDNDVTVLANNSIFTLLNSTDKKPVRNKEDKIIVTLAKNAILPDELKVNQFIALRSNSNTKNYLLQIAKISEKTLTLSDANNPVSKDVLETLDRFYLPKPSGLLLNTNAVTLENGLSVTFTTGTYKTGDYWLIPTRAETNNIASVQYDFKTPQLPEGIQHYYAQLALLRRKTDNTWEFAGDCRNLISALGNKAYQSEPGDNESSVFVDKNGDVDIKKSLKINTGGITLLKANSWITTIAPIPTPRYGLTSSMVNGKIYVIGGKFVKDSILQDYSNIIEEYNPSTNTWKSSTKIDPKTNKSELEPMPTARGYLTSSVVNGKIYVFGSGRSSNPVEVYDPAINKWTTKTAKPISRIVLTSNVVNNKIYLFGGIANNTQLAKVEEYDPIKDTLTSKKDMPTARANLTSSVVKDKIYVIGGYSTNHSSVVEEYDPATDTWRSSDSTKNTTGVVALAPMPTARSGLTSKAFNNKIYVFSGYNGKHLTTVEEYDPTINKWTTKQQTTTPAKRWELTSSVVNNKIYLFGGWERKQNNTIPAILSTVEAYAPVSVIARTNALQVDGATALKQGVTITGDTKTTSLTASGKTTTSSLQVDGTAELKKGVTITGGDVTIGTSTTNKNLTINGKTTANSLQVNSATELKQGVTVTGETKTTLLTASGKTTTNSLQVDGTAELKKGVTVTGEIKGTSLKATGEISANSIATSQKLTANSLQVDNSALLKKGLTVTGGNGINANALVVYAKTQTNSLQVDSTAELKKGVTITGETKTTSLTASGKIQANVLQTTGAAAFLDNTWMKNLLAMPTARYRLTSSVVNGKIYVIGGYDGSKALATIEEYNPVTNTWRSSDSTKNATGILALKPMPTARYYLTSRVLNNKIYVIGGYDGSNALATIEEYNPVTNTWRSSDATKNASGVLALKPMPTARYYLTSSVLNNKIYVIGGYDNSKRLTTVEEYNPSTNTWRSSDSTKNAAGILALAPISGRRWGLTASTVNNKIYVMGGGDGSNWLTTVEAYDPTTNIWTPKASMPTARWLSTSSVVNNKIYVIGGNISPSSPIRVIEVYDPITNTWIEKTPMPTIRQELTSSVVNGKIYVIGGYNTKSLNTVEAYITPTNSLQVDGNTIIAGATTLQKGATVTGSLQINSSYSQNDAIIATQVWQQQQKLQASDKQANDLFGYSVAISGDRAIIGAYSEDTGGINAGAAYVFYWNGTQWIQQQKLQARDKQAGDSFGFSVAISGDRAIVGAYSEDTGEINAGAAYVFYWNGTAWIQQAKLQAGNKQANDLFGTSVAISGNRAIVSANHEDTGGTNAGAAYVFHWNGTQWIQQQQLQASDKEAYDNFGTSVAISGDRAIVGAYGEDTGGNSAGSAYVFHWNGTQWIQQQQLQASDKEAYDNFGISVAISSNRAIIGAHSEDTGGTGAGAAYVFHWNGTQWIQQQKLQASDKEAGDSFGASVAISGDRAIIGAHGEDIGETDAGAAYVFYWNGTAWIQRQKLLASDKQAEDNFGLSVAISGDRAIVGAYREDTGANAAGSAYLWTLQNSLGIGTNTPQNRLEVTGNTSTPTIVAKNDGTGYAFYAPKGKIYAVNGVGAFTGVHEAIITSTALENIKQGMLLSVTGKIETHLLTTGKKALSSTLSTVNLSSVAQDTKVIGVFSNIETPMDDYWYTLKETEKLISFNALGDGLAWVSNINGDIKAGDYITTSQLPGYGMKQKDGLLHNYTLGKALEDVNWNKVTETTTLNGKSYKIYLIGIVYTSG